MTSELIFEHTPFADGFVNDMLQYPCRNPVLYKKANGNIVLFYKIGLTANGGECIKFRSMMAKAG